MPQNTTQNITQNSHAQKENSVFIFGFVFSLYFQYERIVFTLFERVFLKGDKVLSYSSDVGTGKKLCQSILVLHHTHCKDLTTAGLILQDTASWQPEPLGLPSRGLLCL